MKLGVSSFCIISVVLPLIFFQSYSYTFSQETKVYTLEESIAEALAHNRVVKAKEERINQAVHAKNQARAEFLPKLSTSYGYTRLDKPSTVNLSIPGFGYTSMEISQQDNYQWKGTITQPVFTGFALISAYELAKLGIDRSEIEFELQKLDLILNVKEAYFNILETDKAVQVALKALELLKSHVEVAKGFYNAGKIPVNDLLKSEVELANAQQELVNVRNSSRMARCAFNALLSKPVDLPVDVEDILTFIPREEDFYDNLEKAFENRPEIKILDINILETEQQLRLAKSKLYPEISIKYDYIREGDTPGVNGSELQRSSRWEAMAICSWTFWEWGKTHYSIKEKMSLLNELKQLRMSLTDIIQLELKEALLDLEAAEKNIPATRIAVEQAEENLRVSEERYKANVSTSTEVLDAQTLLTRARMNHYRALYVHNLAIAKMERAVGSN
ncbi:MAG: TolC family protein [Deltaproteobacteria bacterium]|nr:TolC family protein [Deltaproteobacteria bacterium]